MTRAPEWDLARHTLPSDVEDPLGPEPVDPRSGLPLRSGAVPEMNPWAEVEALHRIADEIFDERGIVDQRPAWLREETRP